MQFVKVGHAVVHYALRPAPSDLAGAPVMVFLNSLGTDMRIWERVICHFQDYQILQVDKRGHGLSSGTADSVDELALDVAALMDRYGMSNAVVCGVSIGGMIAQSLGVQRPDLVSHLVLCCTGLRIGSSEMWDARIAAVNANGVGSIADEVLARWFAPGFKAAQPAAWQGYHTMLSRTPASGYAATCALISEANLTEAATGLMAPCLVVAGTLDQSTPVDVVQALADYLPNAQLEVLENVGHLPCIEAPDELAASMRGFLEETT